MRFLGGKREKNKLGKDNSNRINRFWSLLGLGLRQEADPHSTSLRAGFSGMTTRRATAKTKATGGNGNALP